jgi:mono/diheme cytochrome c family protein
MRFNVPIGLLGTALSTVACSSPSSAAAPASSFEILTVSGAPLTAASGDALPLKVVEKLADGTTLDLPPTTKVTWLNPPTIVALAPNSTASSPIPMPTAEPTAGFIVNPGRPDHSMDLGGVLFVFDPGTPGGGTVPVLAEVTGPGVVGQATATVSVSLTPIGEPTRGGELYGSSGAKCAACHGVTGDGSPQPAGAMTFLIAGARYGFPAPGLNAAAGNDAGDPAWNPALFAMAARADMDNEGVTLRLPMPDWLTEPNPSTGSLLTTQDFADIFAFLATQTQ